MSRPVVLIADDDVGLVRLLTTVLQPLEVDIVPVHDALSALIQVHEAKPDLVILDINMPSGNGLGVCEMLASDSCLSRVPVIIFTGESGHARVRSVALGAVYVQKGTDGVGQIKQTVSRMLQDAKSDATKSQFFIG